jgi:thioredoxin reductase (NADPH)
MIQSTITSVEKMNGGYAVVLEDGGRHCAKSILFANGMQHKKLGIPGEEEYAGRGVHYCYTCDGPLYKNKILAVAGGSDSAALGTLFLGEYGSKVFTIFRKDKMSAEPISVEKVGKHEKVELVPKANVVEILGDGNHVNQLKLDTGRVIDLDGLFIEIGHLPLSELAKTLGVATNERGYIIVDRKQATNLDGIYAAGDITTASELKQFITSAAEGSIAAQSIYNWIQGMGETHASVQ